MIEFPGGWCVSAFGELSDDLVDDSIALDRKFTRESSFCKDGNLANYISFARLRSVIDPLILRKAEEAEALARALRASAGNGVAEPRWTSDVAMFSPERHYPIGTRLLPYSLNQVRDADLLVGDPIEWTADSIGHLSARCSVEVVGYAPPESTNEAVYVRYADGSRKWLWDCCRNG